MVAYPSQPRTPKAPATPAAGSAAHFPANIEDQLLEAIISGGLTNQTQPNQSRAAQAPACTTPPTEATAPSSQATDEPNATPSPTSDSGLRTQDSGPAFSSSPNPQSPPPHSPLPTAHSPLAALAAKFNISLRLLLDFLASPSTRSRIAAAIVTDDLDLHIRTRRARQKALDALEELVDTATDPIEKRRAATALLRGPSRNPPTSAWSARIFPQHEEEEARPIRRRPNVPEPELKPQQVVEVILDRLSDNDNPAPNAGLETLHNFRTADMRQDDNKQRLAKYLDNPGRDALLLGASTITLHPPTPTKEETEGRDQYIKPEDRYIQRVTFHYPDLTTHSATFHLRRFTDTITRAKSWIINRLEHHFDKEEDDDEDSS